jgi:hypothetical protein
MATENTRIALLSLDQIIRDPESRQRFHENPDATLQDTLRDTEAEPADVPAGVWQALTDMSLAELDAIAALGAALVEAGLLDGSIPWQMVV